MLDRTKSQFKSKVCVHLEFQVWKKVDLVLVSYLQSGYLVAPASPLTHRQDLLCQVVDTISAGPPVFFFSLTQMVGIASHLLKYTAWYVVGYIMDLSQDVLF